MRSLRCAVGWHQRVPDYGDPHHLISLTYRCLRCPGRWSHVYLHGTGGHSAWVRLMPERSEGRPADRGYVSSRIPDRDKLRDLPRGPGPAGSGPGITEGRRPDAVP